MEKATSSAHHPAENIKHRSIIDTIRLELDQQPANTDLRCDLGMALLREERFDEAVNCYKDVLQIDPKHPDAHIGMGHVLIAMGSMLKLGKHLSDSPPGSSETATATHQSQPGKMFEERTPLADFCKPNVDLQPIVPLRPKRTNAEEVNKPSPVEMSCDVNPLAPTETKSATRFAVDEVLNHMVQSIESVETQTSPFTHINFENLFPEEFYTEMLNHLPETSSYDELRHTDAILPNGKSARLKFELHGENIEKLPERLRAFWSRYVALFKSEQFTRAIFTKMNFQANVRPVLLLFRDLPGYKILPHPDIPEKAATVMMYLPRDDSQMHLGTCLYVKNGEEDFTTVKQVAFRPNSGFSFFVTEESWHGVEQTTEEDGIRNSLGIIYFHSDKMQTDY